MRRRELLAGRIAVALLAACSPRGNVALVVNPEARFEGRRTFRILPAPVCQVRRWVAGVDDPMLFSSPSSRAVRDALRQGLEARGYIAVEGDADLEVAYYASAGDVLDVRLWDYGYQWKPRWWRGWKEGRDRDDVAFAEGTVIIDAIDPYTYEVLWRGRAIATPSGDPNEYREHLRSAATNILQKFPVARVRLVGRGVATPAHPIEPKPAC